MAAQVVSRKHVGNLHELISVSWVQDSQQCSVWSNITKINVFHT